MKRLSPLLLVAAIFFAGCQQSNDSVSAPSSVPTATTAAVKPYPLDKCIVSDEKLDSMGEPVVFVHNGQEIKLCCKECRKDFDKDTAKFLSKLAK